TLLSAPPPRRAYGREYKGKTDLEPALLRSLGGAHPQHQGLEHLPVTPVLDESGHTRIGRSRLRQVGEADLAPAQVEGSLPFQGDVVVRQQPPPVLASEHLARQPALVGREVYLRLLRRVGTGIHLHSERGCTLLQDGKREVGRGRPGIDPFD